MRIICLSLLALVVACSGCIPVASTATYKISLASVERPANTSEQYGNKEITFSEEEGEGKYTFKDEMIEIYWVVTAETIAFGLHNLTDHSIKIIWDEAVYMEPDGGAQKVMHTGIKYAERNDSQPPTIIPRKSHITDVIVPTNRVYMATGLTAGWTELPLFPTTDYGEVAAFQEKVAAYKGMNFQILLPLRIEDVTNEYIFNFMIDEASVLAKPEKKASESKKHRGR